MQYLTVKIKAIFVRTQRLLGFVRKEAVIVFPAGAEDTQSTLSVSPSRKVMPSRVKAAISVRCAAMRPWRIDLYSSGRGTMVASPKQSIFTGVDGTRFLPFAIFVPSRH